MQISTENERKIKYKHSKNYREISILSRRVTTFKMSRPKFRAKTMKVWLVVLVIIRLALEVAVELIGSGKCRTVRLLPEPVLYEA